MTRTCLLTLLFIIPLIQGCKQPAPDEKTVNENTEMSSQQNEEDGYMLTKEEARQALFEMRERIDRYFFSRRLGYDIEKERMYRDFDEGYPDGKFDYNYENYVVIETIRKLPPEGIEADEYEDHEIVEEWECNLKEGLFRLGDRNNIDKCGRFRKNKNGEWIATIEGGTGYW